ncbi:hypothetical protein DM02DRAFT_622396 [Periconia macrospinosa]|uniref:Uncharacterized protein n=1 Tax=Periconia macrospinosa TaxID=97972 RepID=A0A2V1EBP5_9PLEO|nr:hypothetical protein DM02DRAFT_622396 [Periconia macrospinosa]
MPLKPKGKGKGKGKGKVQEGQGTSSKKDRKLDALYMYRGALVEGAVWNSSSEWKSLADCCRGTTLYLCRAENHALSDGMLFDTSKVRRAPSSDKGDGSAYPTIGEDNELTFPDGAGDDELAKYAWTSRCDDQQGVLVDIKSMFPMIQALTSENETQLFITILPHQPDILFAIPRERIVLSGHNPAEEAMYLPYAWHQQDWAELLQQVVATDANPGSLQNPQTKITLNWTPLRSKLSDIHKFASNEKEQAANSVLLLHDVTKKARAHFNIRFRQTPYAPLGGDLLCEIVDADDRNHSLSIELKTSEGDSARWVYDDKNLNTVEKSWHFVIWVYNTLNDTRIMVFQRGNLPKGKSIETVKKASLIDIRCGEENAGQEILRALVKNADAAIQELDQMQKEEMNKNLQALTITPDTTGAAPQELEPEPVADVPARAETPEDGSSCHQEFCRQWNKSKPHDGSNVVALSLGKHHILGNAILFSVPAEMADEARGDALQYLLRHEQGGSAIKCIVVRCYAWDNGSTINYLEMADDIPVTKQPFVLIGFNRSSPDEALLVRSGNLQWTPSIEANRHDKSPSTI